MEDNWQNGKFVRSIIVKQKVFAEQFTEFIHMLYLNEYENSQVDIDKIKIEFPSPSSLNMTNLNEQIQNSQSIIQFLTDTLIGEQTDENKDTYAATKKAITKDILNQFDWEKYENLINTKIGTDVAKEKLSRKLNAPSDDDAGGSGF